MMNRQFAMSAITQINGMAPRCSQGVAPKGQTESAQLLPVREMMRPVWIALLSLLFATGVGLGTAEVLTYLFAEHWNVNALYGI